jgi:hypothetical protein
MTTVLPKPLPTYRLFVGIDIAAATAKAAWLSPATAVTRAITIDQTPQAFAALQQRLLATGYPAHVILVVMEATGAYWMNLATTLHHAGFAVSVINPGQAHHFAKALLKRAKTDAIDAQTLAQLASLLQPIACAWSHASRGGHCTNTDGAIDRDAHATDQGNRSGAGADHAARQAMGGISAAPSDHHWYWPSGGCLASGQHTQLHALQQCRSAQRLCRTGSTSVSIWDECPWTGLYWAYRQCTAADDPVHGNPLRYATQSGHQSILRPITRCGETGESGSLRSRPQVVAPGLCRDNPRGGFRLRLSITEARASSTLSITN